MPKLELIKDIDLVVALDIGSTYSGYAWQWKADFENNKSNVEFTTKWGNGAPMLHKTNTALLLKENNVTEEASNIPRDTLSEDLSVVAFGFSAIKKYRNMHSEGKADLHKYHLFKNFKMPLYLHGQGDNRITIVEDGCGHRAPMVLVMSKFIGALKDHFLIHQEQVAKGMDKILWVVTVPAIWSKSAKQLMRDAAEISGLMPENVLLASEPEASAIYCINLPKQQRDRMNDIGNPGHKFLVVDIGGGTSDLLAVKVLPEGLLEEICAVQGACSGGQNVNEAFYAACLEIFEGKEWKRTFSDATPKEMLAMEEKFEALKVSLGSDDPDDEIINFDVPAAIVKKINEGKIQIRANKQEHYLQPGILRFKSEYIRKEFFKEACNIISGSIDNVLEKEKEIQTVVLVGGFSESPIVQEKIRKMINEKYQNVKIEVPTSPFKAVLNGAVLYGHDVFIIKSRISPATYGVEMNAIWDESKHDKNRRWLSEDENRYRVKDVLDVHVKRGQSVQLNAEQPSRKYVPVFDGQKQLSLSLYETQARGHRVIYTDEEGCKEIGKIVVDLPQSGRKEDRTVEVSMVYGGVELSVLAKTAQTGERVEARIQLS